MSIIKSLSVGNGDMFYIKHGSDNFSIIDCSLNETNKTRIVNEIITESKGKGITRFISTEWFGMILFKLKRTPYNFRFS